MIRPQLIASCYSTRTDKFVDQVQVVGYLHDWEATPERAGTFFIFE